MREPVQRLKEVDAIVVNGGSWGHAGVFRAELVPCSVSRVQGGGETTLEAFKDQQVHAVAGIGHPQRFFDLLLDAGLDVIPHPLDDHARLRPEQLRFDEPGQVLVTEKDAVKCRGFDDPNLWCVAVELRFASEDAERLMRLLTRNFRG